MLELNLNFDNNYDFNKSEEWLRKLWFENNSDLYHWNEDDGIKNPEKNYVIDTPPPGVSGTLHMGHIFSYCHTDLIARYKRMKGFNVFYPIGFDDNGQPSEKLVEKTIEKRSHQIPQEEFLQHCNKIIPEAEKEYEKLFKTIGYSYDWRQKYETGSEHCTKLAQNSFYDLYEKDLVYQQFAPVYWDIVDQTALSQADIVDIEKDGVECRVKILTSPRSCGTTLSLSGEGKNSPSPDKERGLGGEVFEIMTTRPELLPACIAVLYNPDDERYNKILANQIAILPFADPVPFIADQDVKFDKGSGLVMCCTYGDIQDKIWLQRHKEKYNLKSKVIIQKDGRIEHFMYRDREYFVNAAGNTDLLNDRKKLYPYNVKKCREIILKKLEENGDLIEIKPIKHIVKCGEYSKVPIEIIESEQWYLKTLEFKEDLLEIIKYIDFHPAHYKNRLIQWIENLNQDWCISRDRVFGIKIPNCENQVFDTWFTSSLTPMIISCTSPNNSLTPNPSPNGRGGLLYPNTLRPQAHEIIRTWAFYTIVKSYLHGLIKEDLELRNQNKSEFINNFITNNYQNLIPWKEVMISGWCLAKDKTKMSKSKGNAPSSPMDLIAEHSADVVRYWAASSSLGVDTAYNETKFVDGKKLVNKLWNASKFCYNLIYIPSKTLTPLAPPTKTRYCSLEESALTHTSDKWIISKLYQTIKEYEKYFDQYEYSKAKDIVENFFWNDFCDNYLEIVKVRAYAADNSALITLSMMIENILKLFAPFLPYITDTIYRIINNDNSKSIHTIGNGVKINELFFNQKSFDFGEQAVEIIEEVRKFKAEKNLSVKAEIVEWKFKYQLPEDLNTDLQNVLNIKKIIY